MKKKETLKIRKSGFNPDRACYLTADGKYYCYKFEDIETGQTVTQKLEIGKDLSLELTTILDEADRNSDLKDRYERELRDPLFEAKVNSYKADPNDEDAVDPWNTISAKGSNSEDAMFSEPEPENPLVAQVRRVIDEDCTEAQQNFFFEHFGMETQLEQMRQAEDTETGKLPTSQAMTNRKNKIVDKTAKALGIERIKRRKSSK